MLSDAQISIEFEKPDRPGLIDLLPLADIAFFSNTYFKHYQYGDSDISTPEEFLACMRRRNPTAILILTAGADGAYYSSAGEVSRIAASQVDVMDSTGAGDTFIAGFIWAFGRLKKGLKESVELAVQLATRKVIQEGFEGVWERLGTL